VTPNRYPNDIISEHFEFADREVFEKALIAKQKTGADWDVIRNKLPENFLDRLKRVMKECWENGFCNPRLREGKIVWSQILGSEAGLKYQEQCDLCRNSFIGGQCKGITQNVNGQRKFRKCWER
jgi:hypothetical protein